MSKIKPIYFNTKPKKNGPDSYYWNPPPAIRKFGWTQIVLYTEGRHSLKYIAMQQADWINAILMAWRTNDLNQAQHILDLWADGQTFLAPQKDGKFKKLETTPITKINIPNLSLKNDPTKQSIKQLIVDFYESSNYLRTQPKTQAGYRNHLENIPENILYSKKYKCDILASEIDSAIAKKYYEELYREISPNLAHARISVMRLLFTYAVQIGWVQDNPFKELGMQTPSPRVVVWTGDEIAEFVKQADDMGYPSIADIVIIACHTAQRQADVLKMSERQFQNNCILVSQNKTKAIVNVPLTPMSQARVLSAMSRNTTYRTKYTVLNKEQPLFVAETTLGRRDQYYMWKQKNFNTWFNKIKAKVVTTYPDFEDKLFLDLRDTAVTLLARAGADQFEIATITGHTFTSITQIFKHYLSLDQNMANRAIKKMVKHLEGQLIK